MEFSEKIDALLTLTATTNAKLAKEIRIDASQISRMRTGARQRPRNKHIIKLMASYFSEHFSDEYRLSALEKLTNDFRIHVDSTNELISTILFDWLGTDDDNRPQSSAERFIYKAGKFSLNDTQDKTFSVLKPNQFQAAQNDFIVYYGNTGKRQAVMDFFDLILSVKSTRRLLIASDERTEWFFEDSHFLRKISDYIHLCIQHGVLCTQIYTSNNDIENAMYTVEQCISSYMAGNIRQYYYPMHRDKLYRHTMYVMPGVAALYSSSLSFQTESNMTILTTVNDVVESHAKDFFDLLSLCKPLANIYTPQTEQELFLRIDTIEANPSERIFKFSNLPFHSLPKVLLKSICQSTTSAIANDVYEHHMRLRAWRIKLLEKYSAIDIIKLASLDQIRSGSVKIPDSLFFKDTPYSYTSDEYRNHLQCIVDELEQYKNYDVIISESNDLDSLALYGVGRENAILVKQRDPFTIVEINEPELACAFIEFLHQFVEKESKNKSKEATIGILKRYISQI